MPSHPVTEAIIAEAWDQVNQPYGTARKIKGFFRNKLLGAKRQLLGGSSGAGDRAKSVGTNLIMGIPKLLAFGAGHIPIVGSLVSALVEAGGGVAAEEITGKLGEARQKDLKARQQAGTMTVGELTEYMQRQGDVVVGNDAIGKMRDSIRKVDEAWTEARKAIIAANDCESVYKAAKKFAYLKYRVVRMNYYIERIRNYLDDVTDVTDRYTAQIVGFELDLIECMDEFFEKIGPEYHTKHCKNDSHCYYKQHGIA